jgi:hypothetical protein
VPIGTGKKMQRHPTTIRAARLWAALFASVAIAGLCSASAGAVAPSYHTNFRQGKIIPLGNSVPHAEGVMVDRRIVNNLRFLADRYAIYVEEGYAGPLPGVGQVGCRKCHVKNSDHYNGLAADIIPLRWDGHGCDGSWKPVTNLARWAEPRQNHPRLPFRWVGYNHDEDHGCGDHLHLSWEHADAKKFDLADWVAVFDIPLKWEPEEPVEPVPPLPPPPLPPEGRESVSP